MHVRKGSDGLTEASTESFRMTVHCNSGMARFEGSMEMLSIYESSNTHHPWEDLYDPACVDVVLQGQRDRRVFLYLFSDRPPPSVQAACQKVASKSGCRRPISTVSQSIACAVASPQATKTSSALTFSRRRPVAVRLFSSNVCQSSDRELFSRLLQPYGADCGLLSVPPCIWDKHK